MNPTIGGALASGGAGIIGSAINYFNQKQTNEANAKSVDKTNATNMAIAQANNNAQIKMFNEQMDYTKALQQQQFEREDNSYQRTVKDLQASGLSPLAMNGTDSAGQVVAQPSAPQLESARAQPFLADTPQFDMASIVDNVLKTRELDLEEAKIGNEKTKADLDRKERADENNQIIEAQMERLNKQITSNEYIANTKVNKDIEMFNAQISETFRSHNADEQNAQQKILLERVKGLTNGKSTSYKVYTNKDEYDANYKSWVQEYSRAINDIYLAPSKKSESENSSGGGRIGAFSINASGDGSSGRSYSEDITASQAERMAQWFDAHPVPIYYADSKSDDYKYKIDYVTRQR